MKPNLKKLQAQVDAFNARHKPGDTVRIRKDNGSIEAHSVKWEAAILSGHTAVGWFDGISGCYLLERVVS